MKITSETVHKQTVYIVQDEKGKLHICQYAPTMNYSGRKDSDQYALMMGLFIDNVSHDLWLDEVKCHLNQSCAWGVNTVNDLTCKIVAKCSLNWDMDKPIGERASDIKETSNFKGLITAIREGKEVIIK